MTKMTNEKFQLLGKRRTDCLICGYPIWAYVNVVADEFYLDCVCGSTSVRSGYSKYKAFIYADGVEATGVEV